MRVLALAAFLAATAGGGACRTEPPATSAAPSAAGSTPATPAPGQALVTIPPPDLARFDGPVRSQMRDAYETLQSRIGGANTPAFDMSNAFGDMGKLFLAAGDLDAAESCFLNARTLAPAELRWPYYLGQVFLGKGDPARSATHFERALQLRPDHLATLIRLGDVYLALGRPEDAEPLFRKSAALDPNMAAALFGLGRTALARRDFAGAVQSLEHALALDPQASVVHYPLGMAYRGLGDAGRAGAHVQQRGTVDVRMRDPLMDDVSGLLHSAMAYEIAGRQALVAGEFQAAAESFRKGIALSTDNQTLQAELRHKLGTALFLTGDARGGMRQFEQALKVAPDFAPAHYSLGVLMISAGQYRDAITHLSAAVAAEPNFIEGHLRLADALLAAGQPDLSLAHHERVLAIDARVVDAQFGRAIALARLGRFVEARDRLAEAVQAHPGQPAFAHALARLLAAAPDDRVRDGQQAVALMQPLMGREPQSVDRDESMAMALAETGRYADAVKWQQEALKGAGGGGPASPRESLAANLSRYQHGQPCRTPWSRYPLSSEVNQTDPPAR